MFKVSSDPSRNLVIAEMIGFLSVEDVDVFAAEEQRVVRQMGCTHSGFDLLVSGENTVIQSQAVVNALIGVVLNAPVKATRIAVVLGESTIRGQAKRILAPRDSFLTPRENFAIFVTRREAEAWLANPGLAAA